MKVEIHGAIDSIEKNDIAQARQRLEKGMSFDNKRIKHIKLADRGPLGWAVVRHYESDALADDLDDEKQIEKARKSAAARNAENKRTRMTTTPAPQRQTPNFRTQHRTESSPGMLCFACNKYGHMKNDCNFLRRKTFNKVG